MYFNRSGSIDARDRGVSHLEEEVMGEEAQDESADFTQPQYRLAAERVTDSKRLTMEATALVFETQLLELAEMSPPTQCTTCSKPLSIKTEKIGSGMLLKWVSNNQTRANILFIVFFISILPLL